jgi:hypothetical protein
MTCSLPALHDVETLGLVSLVEKVFTAFQRFCRRDIRNGFQIRQRQPGEKLAAS